MGISVDFFIGRVKRKFKEFYIVVEITIVSVFPKNFYLFMNSFSNEGNFELKELLKTCTMYDESDCIHVCSGNAGDRSKVAKLLQRRMTGLFTRRWKDYRRILNIVKTI